jgi:hypothetical protein
LVIPLGRMIAAGPLPQALPLCNATRTDRSEDVDIDLTPLPRNNVPGPFNRPRVSPRIEMEKQLEDMDIVTMMKKRSRVRWSC